MKIFNNVKSKKEAIRLQIEWAERVSVEDGFSSLRTIGGMDVSNNRFDPKQMIYACTVTLSYSNLQPLDRSFAAQKQTFPYIPGLLGFREAPALIEAFQKLQQKPDLLMIDGHGISHPRGLGIASHIGVVLNIPTIGVAKSILVGEPKEKLGWEAGSQTPLIWKEKEIGRLFRTKRGCNPLIISAGHKISLSTALEIVQKTVKKYRLPEPTRYAHNTSNQFRRGEL